MKAVAGLSQISTTWSAWAISTPAGSVSMPSSLRQRRMSSPRPTRTTSTPYSFTACSAPRTLHWGALSPPMASTMIFMKSLFLSQYASFCLSLSYSLPGLLASPKWTQGASRRLIPEAQDQQNDLLHRGILPVSCLKNDSTYKNVTVGRQNAARLSPISPACPGYPVRAGSVPRFCSACP